MCWRCLILATLVAGITYGDDITVPVPTGGSILIRNPQFIVRNQFNLDQPLLSFDYINKTSPPLGAVKLQVDIGASCEGEIRQWTEIYDYSLAVRNESTHHEHLITSANGQVQRCRAEIIKVRAAEPPAAALDLKAEAEAHKAKRESDEATAAAAKAAENAARVEAYEKSKAERQKKDAADAAEKDAQAVEEARKIRAACRAIYQSTADKKISNLTVREEQQVRACQALNLYPPQ
jgi:hypothetical protein